jgi:hypothetical protein
MKAMGSEFERLRAIENVVDGGASRLLLYVG